MLLGFKNGRWLLEAPILVYECQLLDNKVVESIEHLYMVSTSSSIKKCKLTIKIHPTPGGKPSKRFSAKQSGLILPESKVRIKSCSVLLLPYSGERSKYEEVSEMLKSV